MNGMSLCRLALLALPLLCAADVHARPVSAEPAPAPVLTPAQAPVHTPLTLSLKAEIVHPLGNRPLMPKGIAHTGESFRLAVWTDQPAYVYVVGYSATGWSQLLFPRARDERLPADTRQPVPSAGGAYVLDDEIGDVEIRVLASREPLDLAACQDLRLHCPLWSAEETSLSRGGEDDKKRKQEEDKNTPPRPRSTRDRGGALIPDPQAGTVSVKSDDKGSARLDFVFRHEK